MKELTKDFVPYEEALALKELGFDEPCLAYYNGYKELDHLMPERLVVGRNYNGETITSAPLYQQAFRFFREKYPELDFGVGKIYNGTNNYHYHINLQWEFFEGTYEEAELACLRKLIEIVKEKQS